MELISELEQGVRLPKPYCCPTSIAEIINHCFMTNPNDRPSFDEIRCCIQLAFVNLEEIQNAATQTKPISEKGLHYADLQFKEMYVDMKRRNRQFQSQKQKKSSIDDSQQEVLGTTSIKPTFETEVEQHGSLDQITSTNHNIGIDVQKLTRSSNTYQNDRGQKMIAPNYEPLSAFNSNQQRPTSICGGEPTSLHHQDVTSPLLLPAKSYPSFQNPSYMMVNDL